MWEHNRARSEADPYVPSNAPPLPEVTWSCEVAQVAQAWADQSQGTQGHSSGEWRQQQFTRLTGFQGRAANLGENLGWMFDSSKNTNVADSVRQFINEREVYDHQNGNCTPTGDIKTCGHYTQVIWRESVLVGCGVTRNYPSSSGSNYGHFLVCSYHNAGNANNDNPLAIHPDWYYQSATQSINGSTQSQTPTGNTGNTSQQPTTGSSRNQSSINIPESQQPNTSTQNQNSSQKTLVPFFKKPFQGNFRMVNPFDHHFPLQFEHYNDIVVNFLGEQLSSGEGYDGHEGYDWQMPSGTPILAVADGIVSFAGNTSSFYCPPLGSQVSDVIVSLSHIANDGSLIESRYQHLSQVFVQSGQVIQSGQTIGLSGNSGCSTGPHLHFGVYALTNNRQETPIDPFGWQGAYPDPWANHPNGATSVWLWMQGHDPNL